MKTIISIIIISQFILVKYPLNAQQLAQTIRGTITDQDTRSSIPGAHILIIGTEPVKGTISDSQGNFIISDVPVGRVSLKISSIGYEDLVLQNLLISSAKELIIPVTLRESYVRMEEIVIDGNSDRGEVLNELATVSARAFSVEETKRYAGSFNDPARMVSSFAGVMTAPEGENYIAVRGNSPKGNQWRLEGMEIPNPNHFSSEGATGGPINALNSNMLANSDFFTGAFPAEYGNAFSGIFDMYLRNGNNRQHEYSFSIGVIGTDMTMEGPLRKNGESSYLVNYRYSTLGLLENLNVVNFDGVPKYQDLSFKINLPTRKSGRFSVFGLGGLSEIKQELPSEENEDQIISAFYSKSDLGVAGLGHMIPLSDRTFIETKILFSENGSVYDQHELNDEEMLFLTGRDNMRKYALKVRSVLNSKISQRHFLSGGVEYTQNFYDYFTEYYQKDLSRMVIEQNETGNAGLLQLFANWKYRISEDFTFAGGLHYLNNRLNGSDSFEPRAGLKWQFSPSQSLNAGFGVHSQMESLPVYLAKEETENGEFITPNLELGFAKSRHFVIGYENRISPNLTMKMEAYYQDLYDIPVEDDPESSFSLLNNVGWYVTRPLINKGSGYNYGLEITLERYFADSYYFLLTTSIYESKYRALDDVLHDTRFNGNYVGNLLFGKEFIFDSKPGRTKILSLNAKMSLIGARRFSPIDLEASRKKGYTVVDETRAFTLQGDDIFLANLSVSYRINKRKTSQEFKIDIQNITNNSGLVDMYYDSATDEIEYIHQLPLLPVLIYTIEF
jgi:hypothetical protein